MYFVNKKFLVLIFFNFASNCSQYDLSVVGYPYYQDGIHRIPITLIEMLEGELKINFINSRPNLKIHFQNFSSIVSSVIKNPVTEYGKIALLCDWLWDIRNNNASFVPDCQVKLAYSMLESTRIPIQWTKILNEKFDAVLVPDECLIKVYKDSGVIIPIFVLPLPIDLEDYLSQDQKVYPNRVFTFGLSASLIPRKNILKLVEAFLEEFPNNDEVRLKIHFRNYESDELKKFQELINKKNIKNIEFFHNEFSKNDFINFMKSLDCYVFISRGEGFSITPREAMSLSIPVILTNNSAHKVICDSGFVTVIQSSIPNPCYYEIFDQFCGYNYDCNLADVRIALRELKTNYRNYIEISKQGRIWVEKYLARNLKKYYMSILKPRKIILGNLNEIYEDHIVTDSKVFYDKLSKVIEVKT